MDGTDPVIYRKWVGILQSAKNKALKLVCKDDDIVVLMADDLPIFEMTVYEFITWEPKQILARAGLECDPRAGRY